MPDLALGLASQDDCDLLGAWNRLLIDDEAHDNSMNVRELADRMRAWLAGEYRAVIFEEGGLPVAYAVFCDAPEWMELRQFFVVRERRHRGVGARALALLRQNVFSPAGGSWSRRWKETAAGSRSGGAWALSIATGAWCSSKTAPCSSTPSDHGR